MTKKRKIEILKDLLVQLSDSANILCTCEADERCEVVEDYIKALEQQPCDDCVSRQAVKDIIHEYKNNIDSQLSWLSDGVCDLPPVTPTFPKGFTNGDVMKIMFPNYKFSNNFGYIDTVLNGRSYSFCPVEFWNAPYKRGNEG